MYLGRVGELADTAVLFTGPRHPDTEAIFSAVPKLDPGARGLAAPVQARLTAGANHLGGAVGTAG